MAGRKKDPLYKSFGYAFQGIFTCIRKERNMKIHCMVAALVVIAGLILGISVTEWCICLGLFGNGDGAGTGEYGSGSCCGSGYGGTSPTGKDRQGHSGRSSTDRSDHGSDRRTDHFCSQGTCFSGNMTGTENFCFRIGSGVGLWCDGPAAAGFRKGENIMELGEGLKKILLVGIGTAAVTAEKSKEILDELVKKGELTVEQGKVLNQELKHNIKSTVKTAADSVKESAARKNDQEELKATISRLTPEQLAAVKAQIERMQAEAAEKKAETAEEPAEEAVQETSAETENAEDTGSEEQAAE